MPAASAATRWKRVSASMKAATSPVRACSRPGAFVIHSAIHDLRPDVVAAAHAHSIHDRALAALGVPLRPVVQEACAFFEDQAVYRE